MSRRTSRVASTIQRSLQTLLSRGLNDPRVHGLITITKVKVTEDMTRAVISISVLPPEHQDLTLHGLRSASKYLRREVGNLMSIRRLPAFSFELDHAIKREIEVLKALERVRQERIDRGLPPLSQDEEESALAENAGNTEAPSPAEQRSAVSEDSSGAAQP